MIECAACSERVADGSRYCPRCGGALEPGTVDPTTTLYNSTMYLMAALLAVALIANLLVRPVAARHHLPESEGG